MPRALLQKLLSLPGVLNTDVDTLDNKLRKSYNEPRAQKDAMRDVLRRATVVAVSFFCVLYLFCTVLYPFIVVIVFGAFGGRLHDRQSIAWLMFLLSCVRVPSLYLFIFGVYLMYLYWCDGYSTCTFCAPFWGGFTFRV